MQEKSLARIQDILFQLEQIDEIFWRKTESEIPKTMQWQNMIGESDRKSNWLYPAEYLGKNDAEVQKIKIQRKLVREMRTILFKESALVGDRIFSRKTISERNELISNIVWARKFGMKNKDCAKIFSENVEYISQLAAEAKRINKIKQKEL